MLCIGVQDSFCLLLLVILHGGSGGMSTLQLRPPEPFDFKSPDGWLKWKRRFEQYRDASGLSGESDARQVSTLLYCLGEEANDVLASTNISEADKKKFSKVIEKFDGFSRSVTTSFLNGPGSIRETS